MNYLDYLVTHAYRDLPPEIKAEIGVSDYTARRAEALKLVGNTPKLPPALEAAYRKALSEKQTAPRRYVWLAAAGWLLAAALFTLILNQAPHIEFVASPPTIVVERDTIERLVYRTRLLRDTFFAPAPIAIGAPRMLVVRDTLYLEKASVYPTGTVNADPNSLSLLVGSRGE